MLLGTVRPARKAVSTGIHRGWLISIESGSSTCLPIVESTYVNAHSGPWCALQLIWSARLAHQVDRSTELPATAHEQRSCDRPTSHRSPACIWSEAQPTPAEAYQGADILASCTDGGFAENANPAAAHLGRYLEPGTHIVSLSGPLDQASVDRIDRSLVLGIAPAPVESIPLLKP